MSHAHARLLREGLLGVALRVFALVAGLLTSWATIRYLGPHAYGVYVTALAVASLLAVLAGLGLRSALLPELHAAHRAADAPASRALMRLGLRATTAAWAALALGLALATEPLRAALDAPPDFSAALLLLLPFALFQIWRSLLGGYLGAIDRVGLTFVVDHVVRTFGLLALLAALWLARAVGLGLPPLPAFTLGLALLELALFVALWARHRPPPAPPTPLAPARRARVVATAAPVAVQATLHATRDVVGKVLLAGQAAAFVEVGVLGLAFKLADIVPLTQAMLTQSLSPISVALHQDGRHAELRHAYALSTLVGLAGGSAVVLLVALWAPYVLPLYGPDFVAAYPPLLVLLAARLAAVAFGPTTNTLQMIQRPAVLAPTAALALGLSVVLNLALIPPYGVLGVAVASSLAAVAVQLVHAVALARAVGVHPLGRPYAHFVAALLLVAGLDAAFVLTAGPLAGAVLGTALTVPWIVLHLARVVRHHGVTLAELLPARLARRLARRPAA